MKLFLASEGSDPKTTSKLGEYVGGFKGKKIVYIPTAKNGNGEGRWKESNTWKFLNSNGSSPSCYQLEDYIHGLNEEPIRESDIIWMTGGAAGYLAYWIYRTGFDQLLREVLDKKVYVGSSAGAMVLSPSLDVCEWYIGEAEKGAKFIPGLNLINFDIYPHYEDSLYDRIKKSYKGDKLYLLKNGEEIIVEDKKIMVIGEERIISNIKK